MQLINATCNDCRLEAFNCGALNVVFNTWVFLGFFAYEIWAEFKKSCGNTATGDVDIYLFYVYGLCEFVVYFFHFSASRYKYFAFPLTPFRVLFG